jgi:hypothetical protein
MSFILTDYTNHYKKIKQTCIIFLIVSCGRYWGGGGYSDLRVEIDIFIKDDYLKWVNGSYISIHIIKEQMDEGNGNEG